MADSISAQIEALLKGQVSEAPGLIDKYKGGLEAAQGLDASSVNKLEGLYSDKSKFEKPVMGALGLGLMKPNLSGNFQDSMYSGMEAAIAAQDKNREVNLSREEKLASLDALRATLARNTATDTMDVYSKRGELASSLGGTRKTMADMSLENTGGEAANYSSVWADYVKNPQKYAGPEGQALIGRVATLMKQDMIERNKITAAETKAKNRPLTTIDKKIINEAKVSNVSIENNLRNLQRAMELGPKSWGGPGANTRAKISSWLGTEKDGVGDTVSNFLGLDDADSANAQIEYSQIMQGEAIKQMAETLKGATTDREMQKFIDIAADDSIPWGTAKKNAIERVIGFMGLLKQNNDDAIRGIGDGSYYTGEGAPPDGSTELEEYPGLSFEDIPDDAKQWAQEQIDGGADKAKVLEYLTEKYATGVE